MSIITNFDCSYSNLHSTIFSLQQKCEIAKTCNYSYINIMQMNFCLLEDRQYITYPFMIALALFCFYFLSNTSNNYLAPSLGIICEKMKLSQNLAGLTILAFGNQAPDLFVAIIAGENGPELALCSLIGSQIFIITIILSIVVYLGKSVQVVSSNFLRDFLVFLGGIGLISLFGYYEVIYIWESICFFLIYFIYVFACVMMDKYQSNKRNMILNKEDQESNSNDITKMSQFYKIEVFEGMCIIDNTKFNLKEIIDESYYDCKSNLSHCNHTLSMTNNTSIIFNPFQLKILEDTLKGKQRGNTGKCFNGVILYSILIFPLNLIRDLTIPPFEKHRWNRWLFIMMPITLPTFCIYIINMIPLMLAQWKYTIGFYCVMILIAFMIYMNTFKYSLPPCEWGLLMIAFIMSILWLWFMTNLLMDSIISIQILIPIQIPQSFFNMTIVSLGNSFPDLFVSISLAITGYAEMAFSGAIGAPVFGLFFSFGLTLIRTHLAHTVIPFTIFEWGNISNKLLIVGIACLAGNIIRMIIQGIIMKFSFKKWSFLFGFGFYLLYVIFIFFCCFY